MTTKSLNEVHEALRCANLDNLHSADIDSILAECPDAECHECGRIICPYHEPLHFHHDGCPACAVRYNTPAQERNR